MMVIWFGVIQQLRGQEFGEGGHQKVHACPPQGGSLEFVLGCANKDLWGLCAPISIIVHMD